MLTGFGIFPCFPLPPPTLRVLLSQGKFLPSCFFGIPRPSVSLSHTPSSSSSHFSADSFFLHPIERPNLPSTGINVLYRNERRGGLEEDFWGSKTWLNDLYGKKRVEKRTLYYIFFYIIRIPDCQITDLEPQMNLGGEGECSFAHTHYRRKKRKEEEDEEDAAVLTLAARRREGRGK